MPESDSPIVTGVHLTLVHRPPRLALYEGVGVVGVYAVAARDLRAWLPAVATGTGYPRVNLVTGDVPIMGVGTGTDVGTPTQISLGTRVRLWHRPPRVAVYPGVGAVGAYAIARGRRAWLPAVATGVGAVTPQVGLGCTVPLWHEPPRTAIYAGVGVVGAYAVPGHDLTEWLPGVLTGVGLVQTGDHGCRVELWHHGQTLHPYLAGGWLGVYAFEGALVAWLPAVLTGIGYARASLGDMPVYGVGAGTGVGYFVVHAGARVLLSGVAVSTAVGACAIGVDHMDAVPVIGVGCTTGVGALTIHAGARLVLRGVACATAVEALGAHAGARVVLSGVAVSTAVGTCVVHAGARVLLSGVAVSTGVGAIVPVSNAIPVPGVGCTTGVGAFVIHAGARLLLRGVAVSTHLGYLTVNIPHEGHKPQRGRRQKKGQQGTHVEVFGAHTHTHTGRPELGTGATSPLVGAPMATTVGTCLLTAPAAVALIGTGQPALTRTGPIRIVSETALPVPGVATRTHVTRPHVVATSGVQIASGVETRTAVATHARRVAGSRATVWPLAAVAARAQAPQLVRPPEVVPEPAPVPVLIPEPILTAAHVDDVQARIALQNAFLLWIDALDAQEDEAA